MVIHLTEEMTRILLSAVKIAKSATLKELGSSVAGLEAIRKLTDTEDFLHDILMYKQGRDND